MRKVCRLISVLLMLAAMVACSGPEKAVMQGTEISYDQQQAILRKKVALLLEKKSYRRAIELMSDRKHPGSPAAGVEKEYLLALNGLIAAGEEALSHGDHTVAGQSFRLALDSYPGQPSLREKVRQNQLQLRKQLETCANRLLEQGLMEYRSDNLDNAIRKWKEILVFDPGHKEALKAIETATVQLRVLQDMEKPGQ
jgi:hypothetical protein